MAVIAVTGAAGFIGRHTCNALVRAGARVHALVRNDAAAALLPQAVRPIVTGDLADAVNLERDLAGTDAVIHLAAAVPEGRSRSGEEGNALFAANAAITEVVFRTAAKCGAKRFVYVSSVKAVADRTVGCPLDETAQPRPVDAYGESKLQGELIVKRLSRELGLEFVIVRPPLVYGAGVGGQFPHLITLARLGRWVPLPLGGIPNRRSLLFVGNLADALVLLAGHPRAADETFFISDGMAQSSEDIVRAIANAFEAPVRVVTVKPSWLTPLARVAGVLEKYEKLSISLEVDDSRIRAVTGWVPPFTFREAIALTVTRPIPLVSPRAPA